MKMKRILEALKPTTLKSVVSISVSVAISLVVFLMIFFSGLIGTTLGAGLLTPAVILPGGADTVEEFVEDSNTNTLSIAFQSASTTFLFMLFLIYIPWSVVHLLRPTEPNPEIKQGTTHKYGKWSLFLAIISFLSVDTIVFGLILAAIAIVFSIRQQRVAKTKIAVAGIIIASLAIVLRIASGIF